MSSSSFLCEVHQQEATQFCLCESTPLFICPTCLPKHQTHETYPLAQSKLFQEIGRNKEELSRRNAVSRNCQAFLNKVMQREALAQQEARALISDLHNNFEMWLEENHRCFETLIKLIQEETALLLIRPKYRVSPITQLLCEKHDTLDPEDEECFTSVPDIEILIRLSEHWQDVCSRASRVWQVDYEEDVLEAFTALQDPPDESSETIICETKDLEPEHSEINLHLIAVTLPKLIKPLRHINGHKVKEWEVTAGDATGCINLRLISAEMANKIGPNTSLSVRNGFVEMVNRKNMRLTTDLFGKVEIAAEPYNFKVDKSVNYSDAEYEKDNLSE